MMFLPTPWQMIRRRAGRSSPILPTAVAKAACRAYTTVTMKRWSATATRWRHGASGIRASIPMRESTVCRCGGVALAGTLLFVAVAATLQWLRHDLDWLDAPLSFYLLGAYGHALQAAYVVLGVALVCLGAGFHGALRPDARSAAPWLLFAVAAVALVVTALTHSNLPARAPTLQGFVHGVAAQAAFLGATVAMLLQSWRLRGDPRWRVRFPFAFALALACFAGLWVDALWKGMPRGLEQKLLIALIVCWLLRAAWWLWRAGNVRRNG